LGIFELLKMLPPLAAKKRGAILRQSRKEKNTF
jgi:hypothetical protein